MRLRQLWGSVRCAALGMVHLQALPGASLHRLSLAQIMQKACEEAAVYVEAGIDGLIVENMHDIPYTSSVGPEVTAVMATICAAVRQSHPRIPLGVQILSAANQQALAVALAAAIPDEVCSDCLRNQKSESIEIKHFLNMPQDCALDKIPAKSMGKLIENQLQNLYLDADFIRVEGFVFSQVSDEGFLDACAGDLLRYRRQIGAENIQIFTDIKKKHSSHAVTSDISVSETGRAAEFFLSDGVILTGVATGMEANPAELKEVKQALKIPVLIGSGVTYENMEQYMDADAFIVGSHFKRAGYWANELDPERIKKFMTKIHQLRK